MEHTDAVSFPIYISGSFCRYDGAVQPAGCLQIVSKIIEQHLLRSRHSLPALMRQYHVSWVILSIHLELLQPLCFDQTLQASMWHVRREGPVFRKEFSLHASDGSLAAAGAVFFGLIDLQTRRLCKRPELLDELTLPEDEPFVTARSRVTIPQDSLTLWGVRHVYPSWMDVLGHMHNPRYGDLIYDALPEEKQARMGSLQILELQFVHELHTGDEAEIFFCDDRDETVFAVCRSNPAQTSLLARLSFRPCPQEDASTLRSTPARAVQRL